MRFGQSVVIAFLLAMTGGCARDGRDREPRPEPPDALSPHAGPPIQASPKAILEREGVRTLQRRLAQKGFTVPQHGRLDAETRRALAAYQTREGLAATGLPDLQTLKRLGLDAKALYGEL